MDNRRDFLKKASLLTGAMGLEWGLPAAIQKAMAIEPLSGSSFLDAEHIVMLMQENRSFDHSFGTLSGVRGYGDPRAIRLPNGNPVWLQSGKDGKTFSPFRLDIKRSKAAWTSYLPHSWENQSAARNNGKHDNWIDAKRSGHKHYEDIPLTMGYYTREDNPFYYAFADAFTICDQNFCSSITGTTTNRHFFWTGTCVPAKGEKPLVRNSDIYFNRWANWKTFPEKLEAAGISWKVYQNEVSIQSGLQDEGLLGNYTDNNLEWFSQYHVEFKESHLAFLRKRIAELPDEIKGIEKLLQDGKAESVQKEKNKLKQKREQLTSFEKKLQTFTPEAFKKLSPLEQALFRRAFQTNEQDPSYREALNTEEHGSEIRVPKGDVLHQFRQDVRSGKLPTVSWLVAPEYFSDHPSAPMYGAWYTSEILNILTENPDLWRKTIFILNYDENDGYFDHIPPFVAPNPADPTSGKVSPGMDISGEFVSLQQELDAGENKENATEGPVGLGYRVPLIIASPWSKGGWVNSEVFDITSTIQFLEHFLNKKYGKHIYENNISSWRRAITGDLTSVFRTAESISDLKLPFLDRNAQIRAIDQSKKLPLPHNYHQWSIGDVENLKKQQIKSPWLAKQEKGQRPSSALAYELYIHEEINKKDDKISLHMHVGNTFFGEASLNSPFNIYTGESYHAGVQFWPFAVFSGQTLDFSWNLSDFKDNTYAFTAYGPNGFMRGFKGQDEALHVRASYELGINKKPTGNLVIYLKNEGKETLNINVKDNAYRLWNKKIALKADQSITWIMDTKQQSGWYDITLTILNRSFERHFAGRVETGKHSKTDPQLS